MTPRLAFLQFSRLFSPVVKTAALALASWLYSSQEEKTILASFTLFITKAKSSLETLIRFLYTFHQPKVNDMSSSSKGGWERRLRVSFSYSANSDLVDMEISGQIYC